MKKIAKWYTYETASCIDHFETVRPVREHLREITIRGRDQHLSVTEQNYRVNCFLVALASALEAAAHNTRWSGDIRNYEPMGSEVDDNLFVTFVPDPARNAMSPCFIWKQNHAGTTFVASPYPLPWLARRAA